jgi:hypothetical protein
MLDTLELFPDIASDTVPRDGYARRPIGRRHRRRRPAPARTVLRRALWERRFAAQDEQLARVGASVARLERKVDAERQRSADNAEMLALLLRKLTQLGHDLQLRETPIVPPRHTRRRPLGVT